jgi:hypothetical protein
MQRRKDAKVTNTILCYLCSLLIKFLTGGNRDGGDLIQCALVYHADRARGLARRD